MLPILLLVNAFWNLNLHYKPLSPDKNADQPNLPGHRLISSISTLMRVESHQSVYGTSLNTFVAFLLLMLGCPKTVNLIYGYGLSNFGTDGAAEFAL